MVRQGIRRRSPPDGAVTPPEHPRRYREGMSEAFRKATALVTALRLGDEHSAAEILAEDGLVETALALAEVAWASACTVADVSKTTPDYVWEQMALMHAALFADD